jgi:hypothetical protein
MTRRMYRLISAKGVRMVEGDERKAVRAAQEFEEELAPSFGVSVEDEAGETVAEIREGGNVEWADGRDDLG